MITFVSRVASSTLMVLLACPSALQAGYTSPSDSLRNCHEELESCLGSPLNGTLLTGCLKEEATCVKNHYPYAYRADQICKRSRFDIWQHFVILGTMGLVSIIVYVWGSCTSNGKIFLKEAKEPIEQIQAVLIFVPIVGKFLASYGLHTLSLLLAGYSLPSRYFELVHQISDSIRDCTHPAP